MTPNRGRDRNSDSTESLDPLHRLASAWGVETSYRDARDEVRAASPDSLIAVLRALGAPIETEADAGEALRHGEMDRRSPWFEPAVVAWEGKIPELRVGPRAAPRRGSRRAPGAAIELEDGGPGADAGVAIHEVPARFADVEGGVGEAIAIDVPRALPYGVHRLLLDLGNDQAAAIQVISAPERCWPGSPSSPARGGRGLGLFAPVHALRSDRRRGPGDLGDLARLRDWALRLGVETIGVLPLLAAFLDEPFDPSPYAPASRLFWNELYLDPALSPDLAASPRAAALLEARGASHFLQGASHFLDREEGAHFLRLDYREAMATKRRVLEALAEAAFESPARRDEIETFVRREPYLDDYASFRAAAERHGAGWPAWPERQRAGGLQPRGLEPADFDPARRLYHLYVQWLWDHQFRALFGAGETLYLDLPIGVDGGGFDAWRFRDQFAAGASVGAPPDPFFATGQDWGFPPSHPHHGRQTGHAYFRSVIRSHLRRAGMLRLDHVMALHRLFWIPHGFSARDGVYVRYPADELYAILALESHRHRARIVGENLGTVPPEVNESMRRHGLLPMRIFQLEAAPDWPGDGAQCDGLAALNTHDTATFAGFWEGRDVDLRLRLGLLDAAGATAETERRAQVRAAVLATLRAERWLEVPSAYPEVPAEVPAAYPEVPAAYRTDAGEPATGEVLRALLRRLAASGAEVVIAQLEDLWLELDPQNVPGVGAEYPSWHRPMRRSLESIADDESIAALLRELAALRQHGGTP